MLAFFRYFLLPFCLSVLIFTISFHNYRAKNNEWMVLSASPVGQRARYSNLYILNLRTGEYAQLSDQKHAIAQTISSDRKWLYFNARAEHQYQGGHSARDIYRMQIDDFTTVENLTQNEFTDDYFGMISPDGEWIYYSSEKRGITITEQRSPLTPTEWFKHSYWWELFRVRLDGTDKERLTNSPRINNWLVDFIHDGNALLAHTLVSTGTVRGGWDYDMPYGQSALYVASLEGELSYLIDIDIQSFSMEMLGYSFDKSWIYYLRSIPPENDTDLIIDLYRVRLDGTDKQILMTYSSYEFSRVSMIGYSPTGFYLYFRTHRPLGYGEANEEAFATLHQTIERDTPFEPSVVAANIFVWNISPDSQWLYYAQDGNQIYRLNTETQTLEHLIDLNTYNYFLAFSLDGEWVYFRSAEGDYRSVEGAKAYLYKMRLDGSDLMNLGDISDLDMCLYPDRCQDNLFIVEDFDMQWHSSYLTIISGIGILFLFITEIFKWRRRRHITNSLLH